MDGGPRRRRRWMRLLLEVQVNRAIMLLLRLGLMVVECLRRRRRIGRMIRGRGMLSNWGWGVGNVFFENGWESTIDGWMDAKNKMEMSSF